MRTRGWAAVAVVLLVHITAHTARHRVDDSVKSDFSDSAAGSIGNVQVSFTIQRQCSGICEQCAGSRPAVAQSRWIILEKPGLFLSDNIDRARHAREHTITTQLEDRGH